MPGLVYCHLGDASLANASVIKSVVLENGEALAFEAFSVQLLFPIGNVRPSTDYRAFCFVRNIFGIESSLNSSSVSSSSCCKSLLFGTQSRFVLYNSNDSIANTPNFFHFI